MIYDTKYQIISNLFNIYDTKYQIIYNLFNNYQINWHQVIFTGGYPPTIVTPNLFNILVRDGIVLFQIS